MRYLAVLVVVLVVASVAGFLTLNGFNHFAEIERAFAGQCTPVTGIAGPEDIQLDRKRRQVFISSLDRRSEDARGAIHLFDLDDPLHASAWRDLTNGVPAAFRPLGLAYYEDDETRRLFVVNEANNSVELFEVGDDGNLIHLERFSERRLTSPNNIVAVGRRSFYVTNDVKPGRRSSVAALHFLMRAASGQLLYTDGDTWRVAADNLRFANGVDISPDGEHLYVAETAGRALRIYERDPATNILTLSDTVRLSASPDNIAVDDAGAVWIGAQPKPLATPRLRAHPESRAPSEVIRLSAESGAQTVYRDDGAEISASSVAARLGRMLVIGALYDDKFLICDLPAGAI